MMQNKQLGTKKIENINTTFKLLDNLKNIWREKNNM